jgi:V/A-type H+-transporting ATPase subunit F
VSRLLVLTTPELAPGYRLAGARTLAVGSLAETAEAIERLVADEEGVIAVHEPYFHALDPRFRLRLDALRRPLVVPLPAGSGEESGVERRERLTRMLWQAIGYEITFESDGGAP